MQVIPLATSVGPMQFQMIKDVYESLVRSDWFYDTDETRQDLSDLIMRQYRKGHATADELLAACEPKAIERYSRP
jgi:hypothetical protein